MKRTLAVSLFVLLFASFASAGITSAGIIPEAQAFPFVVDVNGDGLDDLLDSRDVMLAQGGGNFVKRDISLTSDESIVGWLDVNGDGLRDLLTQSRGGMYPGTIQPSRSVRIQGPGLTFGSPIVVVPVGSPDDAQFGDINGDGKDDVLLQHILFRDQRDYAAQMTLALSRGDGTFETRQTFLIPSHPQWGRAHRLLLGDMNGDGRRDIVIRTTYDLVVLLNRGNDEFSVTSRYLPLQRFATWETQLGDADRDGNLDVIMAGVRVVQAFFGDGRGGFNRISSVFLPQKRVPIAPSGAPSAYQTTAESLTFSSSPRRLMIGEFIAKGRTEILGSTFEGDIFFVAMENNRLQEVAPRISMPHLAGEVMAGSFRQRGSSDFIIFDNFIAGFPTQPKPTLFYADPASGIAPAVAAPSRSTRGRAVASPAAAPLKMNVDAKDCAADPIVRNLESDGLWVHSRGDAVLDGIVQDGTLFFRYVPTWQPWGIQGGLLATSQGGWTGSVSTSTPCGDQSVRITVDR